jgi:hypothetical protein
MADLNFILAVEGVATGTAVKTLIQAVAPANQRLKLKELSIDFHGISNTDPPVTVDLCQQDTAGTSSGLTPVKEDASLPETVQSTARQTFTAEPTTSTPIRTWSVHPQAGALVIEFPEADMPKLGGGKRLGLRVNTSVSQSADCYMKFEE